MTILDDFKTADNLSVKRVEKGFESTFEIQARIVPTRKRCQNCRFRISDFGLWISEWCDTYCNCFSFGKGGYTVRRMVLGYHVIRWENGWADRADTNGFFFVADDFMELLRPQPQKGQSH
jgi:hypothetical protein